MHSPISKGDRQDLADLLDMDLARDAAFSKKELRFEHIGWVFMLVIISAALLGLFGSGPLAQSQLQSTGGSLKLKYTRFARYGASAELRLILCYIHKDNKVDVWLSHSFIKTVELNIIPTPQAERLAAGYMIYTFTTLDNAQPLEILFSFTPQVTGAIKGSVGLGNHFDQLSKEAIYFTTFVYP